MSAPYVTIVEQDGRFFLAVVDGNKYTTDPDSLKKREWALDSGARAAAFEGVLRTQDALSAAQPGTEVEPVVVPFEPDRGTGSATEAERRSLRGGQ